MTVIDESRRVSVEETRVRPSNGHGPAGTALLEPPAPAARQAPPAAPAGPPVDLDAVVRTTAELVALLRDSSVRRLALTAGGLTWDIETAAAVDPAVAVPVAAGAPVTPALPAATAPAPAPAGHDVAAPVVGVFYRSPSPGAPPFVEVGQRVVAGQQLAIVEAMKMMNEIVADRSGVIRAVHAAESAIVEFGERLFTLDPS
jgi:acetyl-CoA carboxylase biotin carboxyl carrier protein